MPHRSSGAPASQWRYWSPSLLARIGSAILRTARQPGDRGRVPSAGRRVAPLLRQGRPGEGRGRPGRAGEGRTSGGRRREGRRGRRAYGGRERESWVVECKARLICQRKGGGGKLSDEQPPMDGGGQTQRAWVLQQAPRQP